MIFTRTKHRAKRLAEQIAGASHTVTSLHSNRSQSQRQAALNGFKAGQYRIMVATDIAARGLDVESISHVINYDMPDTPDTYIHRIGRTGRAERTGDAFTLVTPDDHAMVRILEKIMGQPLPRKTQPGFDYKAPTPPRRTMDGPLRSASGTASGSTGQDRRRQGKNRRGSASAPRSTHTAGDPLRPTSGGSQPEYNRRPSRRTARRRWWK